MNLPLALLIAGVVLASLFITIYELKAMPKNDSDLIYVKDSAKLVKAFENARKPRRFNKPPRTDNEVMYLTKILVMNKNTPGELLTRMYREDKELYYLILRNPNVEKDTILEILAEESSVLKFNRKARHTLCEWYEETTGENPAGLPQDWIYQIFKTHYRSGHTSL